MNHFAFRNRHAALALALIALAACTDEPSPAEPGRDSRIEPRFAAGDVYTVTNTNDSGIGSLRWALSHATGDEIIRFDPSLAGQTIVLDSTIRHFDRVTIEGPAGKGIVISGGGKVRPLDFHHASPPASTLRNLTIRDGKAPGSESGGGIFVSGWLVLENVTLEGNVADGLSAVLASSVKLINSTVSGNTSTGGFAAIAAGSLLELINSTVAGNAGGGIANAGTGIKLRNSIVANNIGPNCVFGSATVTYEGKNLSNDDTCGGPGVMLIADPMLEALADNGGPSRTHALAAGSPAIDAATDCTVQEDQRYVPRTAACDLGAFEFVDLTPVELTIDGSGVVNKSTGVAIVSGTVRCERDDTFNVAVELRQQVKSGPTKETLTAAGVTPVACSTTARPWSVAVSPTSGAFRNGDVEIAARTEDTPPWSASASASQTAKLFWAKK